MRAHQALVSIATELRNLLRALPARYAQIVAAKYLCGKGGLEQLPACLDDIGSP